MHSPYTSDKDRVLKNIKVVGECWIWQRRLTAGYGTVTCYNRKTKKKVATGAHRFSYRTFIGPIPPKLVLDHLCRQPSCVNPKHLEPVTDKVNIARGTSVAAKNAKKTACPKGHPYNNENTYVGSKSGRLCITCRRDRTKKHKQLRMFGK